MRRPSADAVAGNGRPLSWAPSADAVAGGGDTLSGKMFVRQKLPTNAWTHEHFRDGLMSDNGRRSLLSEGLIPGAVAAGAMGEQQVNLRLAPSTGGRVVERCCTNM